MCEERVLMCEERVLMCEERVLMCEERVLMCEERVFKKSILFSPLFYRIIVPQLPLQHDGQRIRNQTA
jgi:hypothetical protein